MAILIYKDFVRETNGLMIKNGDEGGTGKNTWCTWAFKLQLFMPNWTVGSYGVKFPCHACLKEVQINRLYLLASDILQGLKVNKGLRSIHVWTGWLLSLASNEYGFGLIFKLAQKVHCKTAVESVEHEKLKDPSPPCAKEAFGCPEIENCCEREGKNRPWYYD